MDVTSNKEMRYDAFISYRHSELDKFVAEELHKQLENFKVPKNIAKKAKKKKISRIFRDRDELPITSNLADPILNALEASEYLIVICSPRLKDSLWCKREIENFIAMHGQEKVLAVLIEGEPSESFPQELLYRDKTVIGENGETIVVKEPVEPLAADVRGKNKKEVKKLIKSEMLRLLASMLQCNYDDLKQRHKERRMHRILALAAVVGAVGITFGTVSSIMALKIHDQKEQIDKQYWEALRTNAKMGADNALELLEVGDRIGAIQMARELLPDELSNQSVPYTSEAFYALSESLYPYATGDLLCPIFRIKENAEIKDLEISGDRNKIYVRTKYDKLTVWDIPNKKICLELDMNTLSTQSVYDDGVAFIGSEKIALLNWKEMIIFDLENNENGEISTRISNGESQYARRVMGDSKGKYIVTIFEADVCVYDAQSGSLLQKYQAPENMEVASDDVIFRGEDELILVYEAPFLDENKQDFQIQMVDIKAGGVTCEIQVPYGRLAQVDASQDSLFVAVNGDSKELASIFDTMDDADIYCFDIETGAKRWEYHVEEEYINRIVIPYEDYDCFLFESYAQITALEAKSGELVGQFGFGGTITEIFPLQTPDSYVVFTRDGRRVNFIPEKNYNVENVGIFVPGSTNIKQIEWGNDFIVAMPYMSKELIVYDWYADEGAKEVFEFDDTILEFVVSEDEKYSAVELYGYELLVFDNETKEIMGRTTCDRYSKGLHFIGDDRIQRVSGEEVFIYDLQCNLLEQYELYDSKNYMTIDGVSANGKYAFGDNFESFFVVECATGEIKGTLEKAQCEGDSECTYMFNNSGDACVIIDKTKGQCRSYDISQGTLLNTIDINATYIENVIFSENDEYVYFVFEDGLVSQYISATMEHKCDIEGLDSVTDVIVEKTQNDEKVYYFYHGTGAYVLKEYEGELKVEQTLRHLEAMMLSKGEYWFVDYKTLIVLPIYSYEEMLGKADRICYDNSLWNNN